MTGPTAIPVADVAIDVRQGGAEALFTYRNDQGGRPGDLVQVPLGTRTAMGVVACTRVIEPADLDFPVTKLRPLGPAIAGLQLPKPLLRLLFDIAEETLAPLAASLSLAIPAGLRDRLETRWTRTDTPAPPDLGPAISRVLAELEAEPEGIRQAPRTKLDATQKKHLRALVNQGLAQETLAVAPRTERRRADDAYRLTADATRVEAFLADTTRRRPAQAMALMELQGAGEAQFTLAEIRAFTGATDATVRALVQAGFLELAPEATAPSRPAPVLNVFQSEAVESLRTALRTGRHARFLLFGVTGSGKTEVYLRAAAEALAQGRQVLYLVPEIALTPQVVAQLQERFGRGVAVLHSSLTPVERLANWTRVADGSAAVVLGPRSALFAPLDRLGLVIVDEEHESSYKQESMPRYHARWAAQQLALHHGAVVVMGSATPSAETSLAAREGRCTLLTLPARAVSMSQMPMVEIVDLAEVYQTAARTSLFSPRLKDAIDDALARQEQAILFLNRRAYAPFLLCRDCGQQFTCPHCSVSLAFHRRDQRLRCHHCGFEQPVPELCPSCGSFRVKPFGAGVEKVEAAVQEEFPGARVARLDRDSARRAGHLEETLAGFRSREIDILVGTQMVAKGLDFPRVTVVGVVAADVSLNLPDFRAGERTFQLLSQVAGRAGRHDRAGRVVVQTLSPTHEAVVCARDHDVERFLNQTLAEREAAGYPPYRRLINVVFSGEDRAGVAQEADLTKRRLVKLQLEAEVLGPTECVIERRMDLWRMHLVIKFATDGTAEPFRAVLTAPTVRGVDRMVDVDPQSML